MPLRTLFFLLSVNISFGQSNVHYSTKDGLSENYINSIYQDSLGFIWIGTNGGLNKFDGYKFETQKFKTEPNAGVQSSIISSVLQEGFTMWAGTPNDGLYRIDLKTESLHKLNQEHPILIDGKGIYQITMDSKKNIWYRHKSGITVLNPNFGQKKPIFKNLFLEKFDNPIQTIVKGTNNELWLGTKLGLYRVNPYSSIEEIELEAVMQQWYDVRDIAITPWGLILAYYDGIRVYHEEGSYKISNTTTSKLLFGADSTLWCASDHGLISYKVRLNANNNMELTGKQKHKTGNNKITVLFEDKTGLIWVGTQNGIDVINPNKKKFRHFKHNANVAGSISGNEIRAIYEDNENNLWIGTDGYGASILPKSAAKNYDNGFHSFKWKQTYFEDNIVYSFCQPKDDEIWMGVGYHSKSIIASIPKENDFKTLDYYKNKNISNFAISQQLVDRHKNIWCATYGGGLLRLMQKDSEYTVSTFTPKGKNSISSTIIRSLGEDKQGNIWIGTDNGINKIDYSEKEKKNPVFKVYKHQPGDSTSLSHNYIMPIYQAKNGTLWFGTFGGGLNKLYQDKDGKELFKSYDTNDGFPNNIIKGILEDDHGNLWVSSNNGLTRFNPNTEEIRNYDVYDGLQDFEFGEMACLKRRDGEMLFGGVNGINAFYPDEIDDDTTEINLAFTDFKLAYNSVKAGQKINNRIILKNPITYTKHIDLKYNQNSFSIEFTGLNFIAPKKNQYKYKLEGFNKGWVTTSSDFRIANYTNLPSGKYTFKVIASNSDDLWNSTPIELDIYISPPFWKHWVAYLTYAVIALLLIYLFTQFSFIRNKKKNQLVMAEFERKKVDELATLKLDFFTNISHEFRTPLTLIMGSIESIFSDNFFNANNTHNQSKHVINRNINTILRLIRQLSDFRKHEQGKLELAVSQTDIVSFTEQVFISFENIAKSKNISYKFKTLIDELMIWFDADKMEKVLFNLISNALKFTPNNGEVFIELSESYNAVTIKVVDSGIGVPVEKRKHLFKPFYRANKLKNMGTGIGLSFSKKMVDMHTGKLFLLDTSRANGSTFVLVLQKGNSHFRSNEIMNTDLDFTEKNLTRNTEWLAPVEELASHTTNTETKGKSRTILIVDDNISVRNLMRKGLSSIYQIAEAGNGQEALEHCENKVPDLIVSDIMMPEMDGYELCKAIKTDINTSHIPLILLTAKTSEEAQIEGFESGADAYVEKPFSMSIIKARIAALIESRRKLREIFQNSIRIQPKDIATNDRDTLFLEELLKIIETNLGNSEFTTQQLIHEFGSNRMTVNNKLKSMVGCSANAFIRKVRIKKAAELLQEQENNISDVTYMVGFQDKEYFRNCFKEEFGVTPSQFQKQQFLEKSRSS